jgi:uncharacterized membrane protein YhaH (DUF805 family)
MLGIVFCTQCGMKAAGDHKFCAFCGSRLTENSISKSRQKNSHDLTTFQFLPAPESLPAPQTSQEGNWSGEWGHPGDESSTKLKDVIAHCYRNYAEFDGRASRAEFWKWYAYVAALPFVVVSALVLVATVVPDLLGLAPLALILLPIGHIIPTLACGVRRLHDTGRSGFALFIGLIPIIGNVVLFVWLAQSSKSGDNSDEELEKSNRPEVGRPISDPIRPGSGAENFKQEKQYATSEAFVWSGLGFLAIMVIGLFFSTIQMGKLVSRIERSEAIQIEYVKRHREIESQVKAAYGNTVIGDGLADFLARGGELASQSLSTYSAQYDKVESLYIPPWDRRGKRIRSLYLDHSEVWQSVIQQRIGNANSFPLAVEIETTWKSFCNQISNGMPLSAFRSIERRLSDLCK